MDPRKVLVREFMNQDVISLAQDTPIEEAIATLEDYHISGAPVVDQSGDCVGVFTSTDVLKRRREIDEGETPHAGAYFSSDPFSEAEEYFSRDEYDEEVLGKDTVGQWMTTEIKSVPPETTIEEVCKRMVNERVHRLLVMDEKKLRGIITSFDIMRLVAGIDGKEPAKGARKRRRAR